MSDPFARAVTESLVAAAVTLLLLFLIAKYEQNVVGAIVAIFVAAVGFLVVARRARKLMEDYG
jgi:hypothetical protein